MVSRVGGSVGWRLDVAVLVLPTLVHIWSTNLSQTSVEPQSYVLQPPTTVQCSKLVTWVYGASAPGFRIASGIGGKDVASRRLPNVPRLLCICFRWCGRPEKRHLYPSKAGHLASLCSDGPRELSTAQTANVRMWQCPVPDPDPDRSSLGASSVAVIEQSTRRRSVCKAPHGIHIVVHQRVTRVRQAEPKPKTRVGLNRAFAQAWHAHHHIVAQLRRPSDRDTHDGPGSYP